MILLLIWALMRFWDMSVVHNKKQQRQQITTNRECDTLQEENFCCGCCDNIDEVNSGCNECNCHNRKGSDDNYLSHYFKGTNHFLKGLLSKLPLSQLFIKNSSNSEHQEKQKAGLSISQLLAEFGSSFDPDAVRSELAFMGLSEEFLNQNDFQWSQDYSFDETNEDNANLLLMSASYEDMAKHLDAHLAELDIDSFRAEDINSILNLKTNMDYKPESGFRLGGRTSVGEEDLLFSPSSAGDHYLSLDSLDHEMLGGCVRENEEGEEEEERVNELIESLSTNCRANKENYTLAFKDSFSASTDSQSSKESCSIDETRKVSWNQLGNSNNTNQSLDSSGSFVGHWNIRRSPPTKETFQLPKSPLKTENQNMNLVQMFMKQRTLSTSSSESPRTATEGQSIDEFSQSTRSRKKSMNDSGKCSTLSQHVLDEEDELNFISHPRHHLLPTDDYQLDSLDVMQQTNPTADQQKQPRERLRDKPAAAKIMEQQQQQQNSKSIQTSKQFLQQSKVIVFPECKLPNLDFIHLEHEVLTSQFVSGDQFNQLNSSHPPGFDHIVDWDSLLFLLSREHKEMLKRYPVLSEKIRNSFQDSLADVFEEFPETIDVNFERKTKVCDCDSLISSAASTNSSNRYSSDSGLGPNTYNFEDLRKLFVYEYNALDEESEGLGKEVPVRSKNSGYRERRATLSSMQTSKPEKKVSFEAGLPKKRNNKSTSSIPRLITSKTAAPKCEMIVKEKVVSKIPKLIKSPSKSNVIVKF